MGDWISSLVFGHDRGWSDGWSLIGLCGLIMLGRWSVHGPARLKAALKRWRAAIAQRVDAHRN